MLAALTVKAGAKGRPKPAVATPVAKGMKIVLQRVVSKRVTELQSLTYSVTRHQDSSMYQGDTKVLVSGVQGSLNVAYEAVYVDGKLVGRTVLAKHVISRPRTKVENVGTKSRPAPQSQPQPQQSSGGRNWDAGATFESGGTWPLNPGNGFHGVRQIRPGP